MDICLTETFGYTKINIMVFIDTIKFEVKTITGR